MKSSRRLELEGHAPEAEQVGWVVRGEGCGEGTWLGVPNAYWWAGEAVDTPCGAP